MHHALCKAHAKLAPRLHATAPAVEGDAALAIDQPQHDTPSESSSPGGCDCRTPPRLVEEFHANAAHAAKCKHDSRGKFQCGCPSPREEGFAHNLVECGKRETETYCARPFDPREVLPPRSEESSAHSSSCACVDACDAEEESFSCTLSSVDDVTPRLQC